jgi:hypothetical protein
MSACLDHAQDQMARYVQYKRNLVAAYGRPHPAPVPLLVVEPVGSPPAMVLVVVTEPRLSLAGCIGPSVTRWRQDHPDIALAALYLCCDNLMTVRPPGSAIPSSAELTRDFLSGSPEVSEALAVYAVSADGAHLAVQVPYHYDSDGFLVMDPALVSESGADRVRGEVPAAMAAALAL